MERYYNDLDSPINYDIQNKPTSTPTQTTELFTKSTVDNYKCHSSASYSSNVNEKIEQTQEEIDNIITNYLTTILDNIETFLDNNEPKHASNFLDYLSHSSDFKKYYGMYYSRYDNLKSRLLRVKFLCYIKNQKKNEYEYENDYNYDYDYDYEVISANPTM